jgi:hypothetical protein
MVTIEISKSSAFFEIPNCEFHLMVSDPPKFVILYSTTNIVVLMAFLNNKQKNLNLITSFYHDVTAL